MDDDDDNGAITPVEDDCCDDDPTAEDGDEILTDDPRDDKVLREETLGVMVISGCDTRGAIGRRGAVGNGGPDRTLPSIDVPPELECSRLAIGEEVAWGEAPPPGDGTVDTDVDVDDGNVMPLPLRLGVRLPPPLPPPLLPPALPVTALGVDTANFSRSFGATYLPTGVVDEVDNNLFLSLLLLLILLALLTLLLSRQSFGEGDEVERRTLGPSRAFITGDDDIGVTCVVEMTGVTGAIGVTGVTGATIGVTGARGVTGGGIEPWVGAVVIVWGVVSVTGGE